MDSFLRIAVEHNNLSRFIIYSIMNTFVLGIETKNGLFKPVEVCVYQPAISVGEPPGDVGALSCPHFPSTNWKSLSIYNSTSVI